MQSLKDLRLASIDITPEVLQLRHLANLELRYPFGSLTAVLDLVVSNPLLEKIALSIRCTGKTDPWPEGAFAVPYLRSLDFNFYPPVPLFRRLSIPSGASSSLASRTEVECEAIFPGSFEHHHNLSELRSPYIQRQVDYWIKVGGPNGGVEVGIGGKGDPDLEVRRLLFQFMEKLRYAEIRECADTFSKVCTRVGSPRPWIVRGASGPSSLALTNLPP